MAGLVAAGLQCRLDRAISAVSRYVVRGVRVRAPRANVKHYRFSFVPAAALRLGFGCALTVSFFCFTSKLGVMSNRRLGLP